MAITTTTTAPNAAQDTLALIGRVLLAALFVPAGFGKLMGFAGTVGYISSVGAPLPQVAAVIAIVVELGLGLLLLVGFKTRVSAIVLAIFTVAAAVMFHNYWGMPADKAFVNQLMFFKNIAIAGGLLAFAAFGAGRFSIDKK
ncbi:MULTISPECIES: DoxX family protein [Variovorax]|uniref:Oxidoreductase n=1 Tax=Variovorax boronicumulans TaxID=436515 RepID=A0AAW8DWK9_9BURK|nr:MULTISPECIES: DoxX family protein [Variovorax]MDP9878284.1 putative oxidoreductase [Variovorax boronicumulans]MDP9915443.1 putative oxidoreductase [Variovorax boronicumulans]MDP9923712.1 putative oxidoreductase [Variovorax boronicumulans]PBI93139.1 Inner membrane protein YphA [Variovorax boronicumulans]GER11300.1 DoxX family protein [Variovorax boronicumulans]